MNIKHAVDVVLTPLIRREIPNLLESLRFMFAPTRTQRIRFIFALDQTWTEAEQQSVTEAIKANSALAARVEAHFLSCAMSADESFYQREYQSGFDTKRFPYGQKSGPNIQFFKSVEWLMENKLGTCAFLMETDVMTLRPYWLDKINEEIGKFRPFYIAGSRYKGESVLPGEVAQHINGNAVIHYAQEGFAAFLEQWKSLLIHCVRFNCTLAYDTAIEWAVFYEKSVHPKNLKLFKDHYCHKIIPMDAIVNMAGPAENKPNYVPDVEEIAALVGHAAVLHCKGALSWRVQIIARIRLNACLKRRGNCIAFDDNWQHPAITEKHAYDMAKNSRLGDDEVAYFAFPWATLIDLQDYDCWESEIFIEVLRHIRPMLAQYKKVATVCQHIRGQSIATLLDGMGVTDLFWSHATKGEHTFESTRVRIHAFPLYPVQHDTKPASLEAKREHLFTFIGMYSCGIYLTKARNMIFDELEGHPRGLIVKRHQWHYQKIVYDHQVKDRVLGKDLVNDERSRQYKESLRQSVFSLCPSGSGPASIRLWESIGYGAIPVILADTYRPPGDPRLWHQAAVFCPERPEAIRALPDRLAALALDPAALAVKRRAMRQLWLLYGPDLFVYDIQRFLLDPERFIADMDTGEERILTLAALLIDREPPFLNVANAFLLVCVGSILANARVFGELCASRLEMDRAWRVALAAADKAVADHARRVVADRQTVLPGLLG